MSVLSDNWIIEHGKNGGIEPFTPSIVRIDNMGKVISYGTGSYGFDPRLKNEFKIFQKLNDNGSIIDPLNFNPDDFLTTYVGDCCIVPPHSVVLAETVEYFKIPRDVHCIVMSKSTYVRSGLLCLTSPLEAGWEGTITMEFANLTDFPIKLRAGQGCAQINFFKGDRPCMTSYADRKGKYQKQTGVTFSKG